MGKCLSICRHGTNNEMRDYSHLISPVQAARYAHQIKGYDVSVGKFYWRGEVYAINDKGYYNQVTNRNNLLTIEYN